MQIETYALCLNCIHLQSFKLLPLCHIKVPTASGEETLCLIDIERKYIEDFPLWEKEFQVFQMDQYSTTYISFVSTYTQGVNSRATAQRGLCVLILTEQDLDSPKNGLSFMGYYIWPKPFLNIASFDIN